MKSKFLLIKLAVLCMLTIGLMYTPSTPVGAADFCTQCHDNCRTEYNTCMNDLPCIFVSCERTCRPQSWSCHAQCNVVLCNTVSPK
jgi:CDP-diacylglycerol pyrophosphatase